jgi:hypothetical protein
MRPEEWTVGVEIVSDEQRARRLQEAAERSFATAMTQFETPATRRRTDI